MRQTRTVSCVADDEFKLRLSLLAKMRKTDEGVLVRQSIEANLGEELAAIDVSPFFVASGVEKHQLNSEVSAEKQPA